MYAQVQAAAQEYQREFAAKDAAIQALNSEVEALQDLLHSQLEDTRAATRVSKRSTLRKQQNMAQEMELYIASPSLLRSAHSEVEALEDLLHSQLQDARVAAMVSCLFECIKAVDSVRTRISSSARSEVEALQDLLHAQLEDARQAARVRLLVVDGSYDKTNRQGETGETSIVGYCTEH